MKEPRSSCVFERQQGSKTSPSKEGSKEEMLELCSEMCWALKSKFKQAAVGIQSLEWGPVISSVGLRRAQELLGMFKAYMIRSRPYTIVYTIHHIRSTIYRFMYSLFVRICMCTHTHTHTYIYIYIWARRHSPTPTFQHLR